MFQPSRLTASYQLSKNPLYQERDKILSHGGGVIDLISGNVTEHGIHYPVEVLKGIFSDAVSKAQVYRPDPMGQRSAREAISAYYAGQGIEIPAERILLTPGTSLAYWYAFTVLADPGDEILVPTPSYPLFDEIARLAGVKLGHYRLEESRDWAVDLSDLRQRISPHTKAIVLISPHHPTGAVIDGVTLEAIAEIAQQHRLAILSDEVFGEFLFGLDRLPRPAVTQAPLVITLNGFSKLFALPGIKFGWMALSGQEAFVRPVLNALESISDTFLPVNEIVQAAAPEIFHAGVGFLSGYRQEIAKRRDTVTDLISMFSEITCIPPRGGFYAAVRVTAPGEKDDEALAIDVLRKTGCLMHPGFFYDLDPTHLVLSLVSDPVVSLPAIAGVMKHLSLKAH